MIHGKPSQLNLISYIAGDFASGKGSLDPIVAAWLAEVKMVDKGYLEAEEEWRARKRAAKNKKEQPEDPKYPVRCLTLNTTVANLADRLANTQGKHAFSFTPEADTVAQKWPTYDEAATKLAEIEIVLQINGKVRDKITIPADTDREGMQEIAMGLPRTQELTAGKTIVKVICVPKKLVNIVVKG